ncbi:hypothetical protein BC833DRAFT_347731 [Globomyces pollinis-pini]|nr:hypothetical protein BC833DRAFT_347731 [Globomyces pollinis-pini]
MSEKSGSTSDTVSTTSSSLPRKSRFVVDNNRLNPAQTRMENVNSDSQMAPAAPPLIQQQSMGEVRKGRFSVMDSNPSSTTSQTASNSAPNVNTSVSEQPSTGHSAAVVVSQNTSQVLTMDESLVNSPLDSTIGSTTSTLERKAGRFAFQNIPTSAVTSPKLTPTEGIKLPRKFTVTNETNSSTHSSPTTANPPQNNNDTTSSTSDKRGRFQIIGSNPTGETLTHPLLAQAQAPLPLNLTDSEKLSFLLKQNEVQRIIIQDIIGVLNKNGLSVATPSRASSTDSNELKQ